MGVNSTKNVSNIFLTTESGEDSPSALKFFENVGNADDVKDAKDGGSDKAAESAPVGLYRYVQWVVLERLQGRGGGGGGAAIKEGEVTRHGLHFFNSCFLSRWRDLT